MLKPVSLQRQDLEETNATRNSHWSERLCTAHEPLRQLKGKRMIGSDCTGLVVPVESHLVLEPRLVLWHLDVFYMLERPARSTRRRPESPFQTGREQN